MPRFTRDSRSMIDRAVDWATSSTMDTTACHVHLWTGAGTSRTWTLASMSVPEAHHPSVCIRTGSRPSMPATLNWQTLNALLYRPMVSVVCDGRCSSQIHQNALWDTREALWVTVRHSSARHRRDQAFPPPCSWFRVQGDLPFLGAMSTCAPGAYELFCKMLVGALQRTLADRDILSPCQSSEVVRTGPPNGPYLSRLVPVKRQGSPCESPEAATAIERIFWE